MGHEEELVKKKCPATKVAVRSAMALLVLMSMLAAERSSAAEDPNFPGLPIVGQTGGWVGPRSAGINHVARADQWVRLPAAVIGAYSRPPVTKTDDSCRRLAPYRQTLDWHATGFLHSSTGAPEPWGFMGPFTTRTVAFGSVPVEASVEIRQPRDENNLPVGIEIKQKSGYLCAGEGPFPIVDFKDQIAEPAQVEGKLEIAVTSLKVDGIDLELRSTCRTKELGTLALTSKFWYEADPDMNIPGVAPSKENLMTTPYFTVAVGGRLDGTVDIPPFAGCTTRSGEDVSELLTATVSGEGNGVVMRSEGLEGTQCLPPVIPGANCDSIGNLDFPSNN